MRKIDGSSGPAAAAKLPHLRSRSSIHAHLLCPVRLNRAKTTGHPGGPPIVQGFKRHRKRRMRTKCHEDGTLPRTQHKVQKSHPQDTPLISPSGIRGKGFENHPKNIACTVSCRPEVLTPEPGAKPPSSLADPNEGSDYLDSVHARLPSNPETAHFGKPTLCTAGELKGGHFTTGRTTGTEDAATNIRAPFGDNGSWGLASRDAVHVSLKADDDISPANPHSAAERSMRKASLLRFRPATRQELNRSDNRRSVASAMLLPATTEGVNTGQGECYPRRTQPSVAGTHVLGYETDAGGNQSGVRTTPVIASMSARSPGKAQENRRHSLFGRDVSSSPILHHVARCICELCRRERLRRGPGLPLRPTFKVVGAEPKLVLATLWAHGFRRQGVSRAAVGRRAGEWRLLWSSQHLRSHSFRNMKYGQKINSFPRTYECTRKDALSRNMNRMRQVHGSRHFDFAPRSFVLPAERDAVREAMLDTRQGDAWIVKPASSACGRGIFITKHFQDMPGRGVEENWIVQRYVGDALLLDRFKFDLRLYVAVTSFRPLRVYLHKEGLCRLATEPYSTHAGSFGNRFVHLTNYSINKKSRRYEPGTRSADSDEDAERETDDDKTRISSTTPSRDFGAESDGGKRGCECDDSDAFSTPPRRGTATSESRNIKIATLGNVRSRHSDPTATKTNYAAAANFTVANANPAIHGSGEHSGAGGNRANCPNDNESTAANRATKKSDTTEPRQNSVEATEDGGVTPDGRGDDAYDSDQGHGGNFGQAMRSTPAISRDGVLGSKWSLGALKKRLAKMGVDVPVLWGDIHDVVIKTLIAIEAQVSAAVELLAIRRGSCFEMFGFDVLVDEKQKAHLLEVNFAPSLNTDSALDLSVKSKVVADLLTLAGIRGYSAKPRELISPAAPVDASGIPEPGVKQGQGHQLKPHEQPSKQRKPQRRKTAAPCRSSNGDLIATNKEIGVAIHAEDEIDGRETPTARGEALQDDKLEGESRRSRSRRLQGRARSRPVSITTDEFTGGTSTAQPGEAMTTALAGTSGSPTLPAGEALGRSGALAALRSSSSTAKAKLSPRGQGNDVYDAACAVRIDATDPCRDQERGRSVERSGSRGKHRRTTRKDHSGGCANNRGVRRRSGGRSERIAPAWELSGDGGGGSRGPSADEISAVATESASELRRAGGFELIFPVGRTAHKYFKFFDSPRPLERMLAANDTRKPDKGPLDRL